MCRDYRVSIIGRTVGRSPTLLFGAGVDDRFPHIYVVGQTGTGKSTLLLNLAHEDFASGRGISLIDPHGDLADRLSADPAMHSFWNVADPACPYGYNPLTPVAAGLRPLVASGLIDTLKKQWADAWGVRMEHLLRYAILALLEQPKASIADIMPLFLDSDFRTRAVTRVTDPQVRAFWTTEFGTMRYKGAVDGVAPIANKLGAFLAHSVVRRAVCDPEKPLRLRQTMDEGKVLIVNLAKGRLGADAANVLGGLIVNAIANAAYSRQDTPEDQRRPFFLYVDEFHNFTTSAFAGMLSELRKYKVGLVLAHQHTTQLDPGVLEAILGNVGTLIAFRVGATDADILAKQFGADIPKPRDLVNLANYEMFIKLMIDGRQSHPFSAVTLPPRLAA